MRPSSSQTLPRGGAESLEIQRLRDGLAEARQRTLELIGPVSEDDLDRVHDPLMSPLVWDLGHIAAFEDLWLCQRAGGLDPLRPDLAIVYDAAETPRAERGEMPYLRRDDALEFMSAVRERALGVLERVDLSPGGDRLNAHGFVWEMLMQHEHQHNETMLQTLQLAEPGVLVPERRDGRTSAVRDSDTGGPATVTIDGGPFPMGDPGVGFAYDNERPRQVVDVGTFDIETTPVTNRAYLEFVEAGGYHRPELWTRDGWEWRTRSGAERPLYWTENGRERRFERVEPIDPEMPVMHVSWYEADAYARWAGARLPSESEWEKAAAGTEGRRYPWGDEPPTSELANLDQLAFGPARVDALHGATPSGVRALLGDCWEWTATDFAGYRGFEAFPYPQYSEVFFGSRYKVLRGASWATRPSVARNTFRNWDLPERRQIFAGFRCAHDRIEP